MGNTASSATGPCPLNAKPSDGNGYVCLCKPPQAFVASTCGWVAQGAAHAATPALAPAPKKKSTTTGATSGGGGDDDKDATKSTTTKKATTVTKTATKTPDKDHTSTTDAFAAKRWYVSGSNAHGGECSGMRITLASDGKTGTFENLDAQGKTQGTPCPITDVRDASFDYKCPVGRTSMSFTASLSPDCAEGPACTFKLSAKDIKEQTHVLHTQQSVACPPASSSSSAHSHLHSHPHAGHSAPASKK